jgi:ADP-dependent phosphofructokinase/glucokinase
MDLFLQTYDKYVDNIDKIKQSDIDKLFKAFSTQAWVPISKEISKGLKEEIEGLFK